MPIITGTNKVKILGRNYNNNNIFCPKGIKNILKNKHISIICVANTNAIKQAIKTNIISNFFIKKIIKLNYKIK